MRILSRVCRVGLKALPAAAPGKARLKPWLIQWPPEGDSCSPDSFLPQAAQRRIPELCEVVGPVLLWVSLRHQTGQMYPLAVASRQNLVAVLPGNGIPVSP